MVKTGSMGLGIIVGFILMGVIGWIPIIGALIAGVIAGAITRGAGRGLLTGFIAGIIGILLLEALITTIGGALGGGLGAAIGGVIGIGVGTILGLLAIGDIFLITIGGLIGGALRPREVSIQQDNTENEKNYGPKDEEKSEDDHIKVLKLRYAKGEITKKQYDTMKKDIE